MTLGSVAIAAEHFSRVVSGLRDAEVTREKAERDFKTATENREFFKGEAKGYRKALEDAIAEAIRDGDLL